MSYTVPVFTPTATHGYEWSGYVFAELTPQYAADADEMDPVARREAGILETEDGRFIGARFNALESRLLVLRVEHEADPRVVTTVVSLN